MEKILSNLNLNFYDKLYVSSDIMKVKYTGHLWNKVKKDNPEESILHIGDNLNTDIYMPKKIWNILFLLYSFIRSKSDWCRIKI